MSGDVVNVPQDFLDTFGRVLAERDRLKGLLAAVEAVCADACHRGNHINGVSVVAIPDVRNAMRGVKR